MWETDDLEYCFLLLYNNLPMRLPAACLFPQGSSWAFPARDAINNSPAKYIRKPAQVTEIWLGSLIKRHMIIVSIIGSCLVLEDTELCGNI